MINKLSILAVGIVIVVAGFLVLGKSAVKKDNNQSQPVPTTQTQQTQVTMSPSPTTQTATSEATQKGATVNLTNSGFNPKTVTIKVGEKVTWTNKSGENATVNSDPHPTHTAYLPLNLGRFDNGASVSLVFDKQGTYGYHNHLDSSQTGTVVVE